MRRPSKQFVSAFAFDLIREALKTAIIERGLTEAEREPLARELVRAATGVDSEDET